MEQSWPKYVERWERVWCSLCLEVAVLGPCWEGIGERNESTPLFVFWNWTGADALKYNRGGRSDCIGGINGANCGKLLCCCLLSSWRTVGCCPLHVEHCIRFRQSLFECPWRRHPKHRRWESRNYDGHSQIETKILYNSSKDGPDYSKNTKQNLEKKLAQTQHAKTHDDAMDLAVVKNENYCLTENHLANAADET